MARVISLDDDKLVLKSCKKGLTPVLGHGMILVSRQVAHERHGRTNMLNTNETFQQTFASSIISIVYDCYTSGVLQYHPLVIADMTITMTMYTHFNQVAVQFNGRLLSVSVFDTDSESVQYATIQNLIADVIA